MSIGNLIAGLLSPSYRKREKFRSIMVHPDARVLYDAFIRYCAIASYSGISDGSETVGTMVAWMKSCFGQDICAGIDDFRALLIAGGWEHPVNEQMKVHPALFEAIASATQDLPRHIPQPITNSTQAAAYVDNMMRRR